MIKAVNLVDREVSVVDRLRTRCRQGSLDACRMKCPSPASPNQLRNVVPAQVGVERLIHRADVAFTDRLAATDDLTRSSVPPAVRSL